MRRHFNDDDAGEAWLTYAVLAVALLVALFSDFECRVTIDNTSHDAGVGGD